MKKKIIAAMLSLCMAVSIVPVTAVAGDKVENIMEDVIELQGGELQEGDYKYRVLEDGTAEIVEYIGSQSITELIIPDVIAGYTVTSVGDNAVNKEMYQLEKIVIPDTVTHIGSYAFYNTSEVVHYYSVRIPESVINISGSPYDAGSAFNKKYATLCVYDNSPAYIYAQENGFKYVVWGGDISQVCTITLSRTDYTYSGTEKKPEVIVKKENVSLIEGLDYSVSYKNNVDIGTGTVSINGIGVYTGNVEKSIEIKPNTIESEELHLYTEYPIIKEITPGGYTNITDEDFQITIADESICKVLMKKYNDGNLDFGLEGLKAGKTELQVLDWDQEIIAAYQVTVENLPEDVVPVKDIALRTCLLNYDANGDGYISKTELAEIEDLNLSAYAVNIEYGISDLSGLEYATNLKNIVLTYQSELRDVLPLMELKCLNRVYLNGTNVPISDKWNIAIRDTEMYVGEVLNIYSLVGVSDALIVNLENSDNIEVEDQSITALKPGTAKVRISYEDYSSEITITVKGIDANQSIGEYYDGKVDIYQDADLDYSLVLGRKGNLYQISKQPEKIASNNKEVATAYRYYVDENGEGDLRPEKYGLDNNNVLWNLSTSEKVYEDIDVMDVCYALNSNGTLYDLIYPESEPIENVKDWENIRSDYTGHIQEYGWGIKAYILKKDGTLWQRSVGNESGKRVIELKKIKDNVKEINEKVFLCENGEIYSWYDLDNPIGTNGEKLSAYQIGNVQYYGTDGYWHIRYLGISVPKEVVQIASTNEFNQLLLTVDGTLYLGNYEGSTEVDTNVERLVNVSPYDIYQKKDGLFYSYNAGCERVELSKEVVADYYYDNLVLYRCFGSEDNWLKRNDVDILNYVEEVWQSNGEYYALRIDGTIWNVTTIPKKILDLREEENLPILVNALILDKENLTLKLGGTQKLAVTILPEDVTDKSLIWKSSNSDIATVDNEGTVTAIAEGDTTITVTASNGVSAECKVTVIKASEEKPDPQPDPDLQPDLPFDDVNPADWFYNSVSYVNENGLMTGLNETTFGPAQSLARAQFAVILHRMNDTPEVTYTDKFPDVPDGIWFTNAILWASSTGVVTGYSNTGKFGPSDNINREQMAVMMYRYAKYMDYDISQRADFSKFADASRVNSFAEEAMQWAVGNEIITGKDNGTKLDPQGNASRAECATIIMRFVEKYSK